MTALTVYMTNTAASTLTTASLLATTTGGSNVGIDTALGTATGYGEFRTLGNVGAWAAAGSLPAQSGHGMLLDSTLLEGQALNGTWTPTVRGSLHNGNGNVTADIIIRVSIRHTDGSYTTIGTTTLAGQTITSTAATYTFSATTLPEADVNIGDKLYLDWFFNVSVNGNTLSGMTLRFNTSSSSTLGNTTNQVVTPGYVPITALAVTDSASGTESVSVNTLIDAGVATESTTISATAAVPDAGVGGDGTDIVSRSPLTLGYSQPGVVLGGPYVVASGTNFAQAGTVLPRLYGSTFYPAQEGGSPLWQASDGSTTTWIDGLISTYIANRFRIMRPTDQWGGNGALSWDNPAIWTNMDYLVQQAYLNGIYVQMDLSGWKSVLSARGANLLDPNNWIPFLSEAGSHYRLVPNILFYTISGEPSTPHTQSDVDALVSFYTATIAALKLVDTNHLVSPGGFINMNNGLQGASPWWQQVWAIPSVDVCCYKTYSQNDLNHQASYSLYATQTLGKIACEQEFGVPQYVGDGVATGQTFNSFTGSRVTYYDTVYKTGEQNGTVCFIFWNYDHQGTSIQPSPDFPAIADSALGSDATLVPSQSLDTIFLNDAGVGQDILQALTQSYDVDPNSSPALWAVIQQHAWSVPNYPDTATGADAPTFATITPAASDAASGSEAIVIGESLSDAATGSDASTLSTVGAPASDAGAGGGESTIIQVTAPISDAGSTGELPAFGTITPIPSDAATGSDVTATGTIAAPSSDTAVGSEATTFGTVAPTANDLATGTDIPATSATIPVAESATGSDATAFGTSTTTASDLAAGSDAQTIATITPSGSDAASGSDATAISPVAAALSESATGSDVTGTTTVTTSANDLATGSDATQLGQISLSATDAAAGTETQTVSPISPSITESASAAESASLAQVSASTIDVAAGTETTGIASVAASATDAAISIEAVSLAPIAPSITESGSGGDVPTLGIMTPAIPDMAAEMEATIISVIAPLSDIGLGSDVPLIQQLIQVIDASASLSDSAALAIPISDVGIATTNILQLRFGAFAVIAGPGGSAVVTGG